MQDQSGDRPDFDQAKSELTDKIKHGKRTATEAIHDARDEISRKAGEYAGEAKDDSFSSRQRGRSESLLLRAGVCRDFAHLGIAFCRALNIPARFVSCYAYGLEPRDFHAVFEAYLMDAGGSSTGRGKLTSMGSCG